MKLQTDPEVIAKWAKKREDENWRFRTFLKGCDLGSKKLDAVVHRFYEEVSSQIDCRECGNCCRKMFPILSTADVTRLARGMELPEEKIIRQLLTSAKEEEEEGFKFNTTPCPLLAGNLCTAYKFRPDSCRSYPHLHKEDFISRLIQAVENCAVCPIVFHVYERLKKNLWRT